MTRNERRILVRTLALGLGLTLVVIAADAAGLLAPLERFLYDQRARYCQYFTPQPTDWIVHLNIDDPSIKEIGRWPWPRTKLAELIDEINLAGAKVIGTDIIFPDPQETRYEKLPDGSFKAIEDDKNLAVSVKRAGNVLIPVSVQLGGSPSTQPASPTVQRLMEFALPMPPGLSPMLHAESELETIPSLVEAARYCGMVEFSPDQVVRTIPLFVNYRGRLMPHMALSAFCAAMDVKISDLKVQDDSIAIPVKNGTPIIVPIHSVRSSTFGEVGMFMDVPWFGKSGSGGWTTVYDWPKHTEMKQQEPIRNVWAIRQMLHDIEKVDYAMFAFNKAFPSDKRGAFLAKPDMSMRADIVASTLKEMTELADIPALEKSKPGTLGEDDQKYLAAYQTLNQYQQAGGVLPARIENARAELRQKLNGKYVLIGWTATGKTDVYPTSLGPDVPGVQMQGIVFNALATRDFWSPTSWWVGAIITLFMGMISTLVVAVFPSTVSAATAFLLAGVYLVINGIVLFDYGNRIVPAAAPIAVALLISFGVTAARFIYERRERFRITERFSSRVDPMLVNFVMENPEMARFDGQKKEMSVVFTDLAGFTTISEKLGERTVPLLNEYMSLMLPIIRNNRGYWNKFLGDGIMFFFNAPGTNERHAMDAVHTVLQMQKAMVGFNQSLFERGLPKVAMRAGIATGMMVVGDAGSTDPKYHASDYTVLGDEVNLGARLESANKAIGTHVLINQRAAKMVESEILLRPVGVLQVVGKTEGVMTYEALCLRSEATDRQKLLVEISTHVLQCFRGGKFDSCIEAAKKIEEAFGSSKFTQLYLHLSRQYLGEPPDADFDGLIVLDEK